MLRADNFFRTLHTPFVANSLVKVHKYYKYYHVGIHTIIIIIIIHASLHAQPCIVAPCARFNVADIIIAERSLVLFSFRI